MKKPHVIVVGGGASGIVAAITAAREGAIVTLAEQKDRVGKKILSTGNGRCNLTNEYMDNSCFRGDNLEILSDVLGEFGYKEATEFFESLGVILKNKQGYIYPISDQASTIVDLLDMELTHLNVHVLLEHTVLNIQKKDNQFIVKTNKETLYGDSVILSTGGKAAPVFGSDGSGYKLAKSFGHSISPVVPALVQLKGVGKYFKQIAGVRTQAKASVFVENKYISSDV